MGNEIFGRNPRTPSAGKISLFLGIVREGKLVHLSTMDPETTISPQYSAPTRSWTLLWERICPAPTAKATRMPYLSVANISYRPFFYIWMLSKIVPVEGLELTLS